MMDKVQPPSSFWPPVSEPAISFAEASEIVTVKAASIVCEGAFDEKRCELLDASGLVLAADMLADRDQPPFPRVTRDGFAVRAADLAAGTALRIVGELRAGEPWPPGRPPVGAGEAVEIMTGAALPPGADAVLMIEHAELRMDRGVALGPGRTVAAGDNVVRPGSEARRGDRLLGAGTRLGAAEIALAAACGLDRLAVFAPPAVAILATGDELIQPATGGAPEAHRIYDSNSPMLAALVRQAHAVALRQPTARDEPEALTARILDGLRAAPLLLLTGGVSMGRYDLVEQTLARLGAEFFFTGVRIRPGKPVVFGRVPPGNGLPARFFFGLPGNPVSAMITFRIFVAPLLAAMAGERNWQASIALARLGSDLQFPPGLTRFVPVRLHTRLETPVAMPLPSQGSGDLAANAQANGYVIVPENCDAMAAGQPVRVLLS